jgi:Putative binding domain, N-terminal/NHL repeat/Bacterial Ig domain
MTTRDPKLPLVLIVLCLGAGVYASIRLITPPASAATSQDQQATNHDTDDAQTAAANPVTNNQPGLHAIFRSTASGDPNTWTAQVRRTDANKLNTVLFSWTRDAFYSECGLGPGRFFNTGWYANTISVDPTDVNRVWVGGVELFRSDDGGFVAIDPGNTNVIYAATGGGFIRKSSDGGRTFVAAVNGIADLGFVYIAPLVIDPSDGARLWTGGRRLWRTTDGASRWTAAGAQIQQGSYSAIAVAPSDSNFVLAGTNAGQIFRSGNALSAGLASQWTFATPRGGYVSWISFDPVDPSVVYATYSTFGGVHVWRSADGGATWSGIDGSGAGALPDVPVHCLVVDPQNRNRLFIGSDVGVFVTTDGGETWAVESGESWIRINGANSGGGDGTINFTVEPNTSAFVRAGTINIAGRSFTVTQSARRDESPPVVRITSPTSNATFKTTSATINLSGAATDDTNVVSFEWSNDRGFSGSQNVVGKSPWSLDGVSLYPGLNNITITARDPFGRTGGATIVAGGAFDESRLGAPPKFVRLFNTYTAAGNVYFSDFGNHRVRKISAGAGVITSVVGGGFGFGGDGGPAGLAKLNAPRGVAIDAAGNLYIADTENRRVRKVSTSGVISTVAGNGERGVVFDGRTAINSPMISPMAVTVDIEGNLYITDFGVNKVGIDGVINRIAGDNVVGPFRDEGGPPLTLLIGFPTGVAVDRAGSLYVADNGNHRVVLITRYRGMASAHAASFAGPPLASETIVAAFGVNLATTTQGGGAFPLPTTLAGTSVRVRDGAGVERFAPLFFISPSQVNYQIPPDTVNGPATVIVTDGRGNVSSGSALIESTAPGLFSANADGQGVAAAVVLRIKADGSQIYEPVSVFDSASTLNRRGRRVYDVLPAAQMC